MSKKIFLLNSIDNLCRLFFPLELISTLLFASDGKIEKKWNPKKPEMMKNKDFLKEENDATCFFSGTSLLNIDNDKMLSSKLG